MKLINNKANLVTYPELVKYNSIDDALGPYKACIILYLTSKNYGHWCCLFRKGNVIYFFDSYGIFIDDELKFTDENFRKANNQYYPHLTYLLHKSPYKIDYNNHKLQSENGNITTCGRFVGCRLILRNLNNDQFASLFKNNKYTPDELVTLLTS